MKPSDQPLNGVITAAFGRQYEVEVAVRDSIEADQPAKLQCYPRGKKSVFACGDEVEIIANGKDQGVITRLCERQNLLWRSDAFREKLIAANLTQIVVVTATEPDFSDLLISRCIAAAESQHIKVLIALNKADLTDLLPAARRRLETFSRLGYRVVELSARGGAGELRPLLAGERSIFVGQSGMGKSTLTNALIPEAQAATREISEALNSGKHTTTFARLYPLDGGWLIDSPGLQAFGLAHLTSDELLAGFIEFNDHLGKCRFRDCLHESEPDCALRAAVESGAIDTRRFEHFRLIREEIRAAKRAQQGW
ncbi:MAG TPA: ribosome small subunit-dependent GTPase A [Aromatoleum sp.]|uniref:ribosome small subunit-dependent GTPase A n=1 Tax=Aromatoleum sp. TaxID=2307007 RepID=UPI002B485B9E|nr:ribosome small subunit-dependent GTPase A [Aromatoleum sp.]HJV28200.1 ribosome small subunit-dependent GTPase A [Aromatoleum sp.]